MPQFVTFPTKQITEEGLTAKALRVAYQITYEGDNVTKLVRHIRIGPEGGKSFEMPLSRFLTGVSLVAIAATLIARSL